MSISRHLLGSMSKEQIAEISPKIRWLFQEPPLAAKVGALVVLLSSAALILVELVL